MIQKFPHIFFPFLFFLWSCSYLGCNISARAINAVHEVGVDIVLRLGHQADAAAIIYKRVRFAANSHSNFVPLTCVSRRILVLLPLLEGVELGLKPVLTLEGLDVAEKDPEWNRPTNAHTYT